MPMQGDALVATFSRHCDAEAAVRKIDAARLDMKHFSIVEKDHRIEEPVTRHNNNGGLIQFWGQQPSIWGELWGVFFGGMIIRVTPIGPVVVIGHLAGAVFSAIEGSAVAGRLGVLGAAFAAIGLPKDSVVQYGEALRVDGSLIIAHGPAVEMAQAKTIVETTNPIHFELHQNVFATAPVPDAPF